jgi:hypothetical protein
MHPDIARRLAAERQADLLREARAWSIPTRRPWRRFRRGGLARYAGVLTGARSGT